VDRITETADVLRNAASFAQCMRNAQPGEWTVVKGASSEFVAKRAAFWYNNNFGCASRIVKDKYVDHWSVECQKAKKQPFAK